MLNLALLWRGALIGLAIAAPVGPIGLLCIQRTLQDGRKYGFVSGLGAASADGIYGSVAGFGLTSISGFLAARQMWLALIGGLFLCYLGLRTFLSQPAEKAVYAQRGSLFKAYAATFLLTLTNPITILSFMAIFAGLGLAVAEPGLLGSDFAGAGRIFRFGGLVAVAQRQRLPAARPFQR